MHKKYKNAEKKIENSLRVVHKLRLHDEVGTLDYLINPHCAFIYFQEKSCPVRPYSIVVNSTMTALCVYLFLGKYPALCACSILCACFIRCDY